MTMCLDDLNPYRAHGTPRPQAPAEPGFYHIRIRGCLDSSWSIWFDGLSVQPDEPGSETAICGIIADQAALHGLLAKVFDLGIVLLEVTRGPRANAPLEASADGSPRNG
jgi:hypothetical protein